MAIQHAHQVLDWNENLLEDEMPPEWMWPLDHELVPWFDDVKRKREEKYGTSSDSGSARETVPLMDNALTEGKRR